MTAHSREEFEQKIRQIIREEPVIWERASGQASDGSCSVTFKDDFVGTVTGWQFSVTRIEHQSRIAHWGYATPEGGLQTRLCEELSKLMFDKASCAGNRP